LPESIIHYLLLNVSQLSSTRYSGYGLDTEWYYHKQICSVDLGTIGQGGDLNFGLFPPSYNVNRSHYCLHYPDSE
jgi:hypothetical protein